MWFIFYGHMLNMTKSETDNTDVAEMVDLINCLSVYNGQAEIKKRKLTIDDLI